MNRKTYGLLILETFGHETGWKYYSNHINTRKLIEDVAAELFYRKDLTSPLAVETHRLMTEHKVTGEIIVDDN
jgi:hypothetical protein